MAAEWASDDVPRVSVGELAQQLVLSFGDGYRTRRDELGRPGFPILRVAQVVDGSVRPDDALDFVREEFRLAVGPKLSRADDVVLTTKGTFGRRAYLRDEDAGYVYSPQVCFFRVEDRDRLHPRYLYYWLGSQDFERQAHGMKSQTDMADYLSLRDLAGVTLPIPPVGVQHGLVEICGALDDKIELNRRMSETLEATAKSPFRSWFVDFDPVVSKAQGRDSRLPSRVAAHFPDTLEASTLGDIPSGWRVENVYAIADVIYGAPFRSSLFNSGGEGKPLIRIRDLVDQEPTIFTPEVHPRGHLVRPGDLVVGMDGEFRAHLWRGPEAWLNQRLCCFKPRQSVPRGYVHYSIEAILDFFERSKSGTTVIHLGKGDIDTFKVLLPPMDVLAEFGRIVDPLDARIVVAAQESRTLAALRDTLLPKLISGQLRVPDAERIAVEGGA